MEKRHTLRFHTDNGSLELETNDLTELGRQQWFAGFFNKGAVVRNAPSKVKEEGVDWERIARETNAELKEMHKELIELQREKQELKEDLQREVNEMRNQVSGMINEKDVEEISKELESSNPPSDMPSPRQNPAHVQVQPGVRPAQPPSSFLEIVPPQMNEQIWGSLNPEQQQQWLRKYNLA